MYDGLISSLRICGRINSEIDNCIAFHDGSCEAEPVCMYELMGKAANAIEELQADKAALNGTVENLLEQIKDLCKPSWIPVTERLPEEYKNVLCYYEYFRYGDYNCMFRTIDRGYYGNGIWGGEAGQGHKNKVLAWMPLPEPPKGTI